MRILCSGYHNPHFLTVTEYIEYAIRSLGHDLSTFDPRRNFFPGRIQERFRFIESYERKSVNRRILRKAFAHKAEAVIVTGGFGIDARTIMKMKERGIMTVLWTTDAPENFQLLIDVASCYDHIFCQGTEAVELFEEAGIMGATWLPMACDPDIHRPVKVTECERKKYNHDIVFVGSYYPNRWETFKQLKEFNFGIWGPHWDKVQEPVPDTIALHSGNIMPKDWLRIFSCAKIVLIMHYQDGIIPCYQASPKVFEALACKKFILVDRQRDVFDLFEDRKHLVAFENVVDLRAKIGYYLDRPDKRNAIAQNGFDEVIRNNTYVHRIEKMMDRIQCQKSK